MKHNFRYYIVKLYNSSSSYTYWSSPSKSIFFMTTPHTPYRALVGLNPSIITQNSTITQLAIL